MVALACLYTLIAFYTLRPIYAASSDDPAAKDSAKAVPADPNKGRTTNIKDILVAHDNGTPEGTPTTKELAEAGEELRKAEEAVKASKDQLENMQREQEEIKEEVGPKRIEKIKELLKKKKELLKRIASIGKTLRYEHDQFYPHLIGKPIIIIATDENDKKRVANTLAHIEGARDFIRKLQSPCSSLERIQDDGATKKKNKHDRFKIIQKTLDSMPAEERLNYDEKMIQHYEGIIQEIEAGIEKANVELAQSWKNYSQ